MVDAGPGVLAELVARHDLADLRAIVVTHPHADHSLDLMALAYRWTFPVRLPRIPTPHLAPAVISAEPSGSSLPAIKNTLTWPSWLETRLAFRSPRATLSSTACRWLMDLQQCA
ncbi:MBL fold metallo-hydrolase [Mycetocola miduiensis]|uniref:MBL fold metallo-hydrolase n=1 Tax=Mycetocola miduiensis TaxID=995034 RepID=UPI003CCC174A